MNKSIESRLEYLEEQIIILKMSLYPQPPLPEIAEFLASRKALDVPGLTVKGRKRTPLKSLAELYGLPVRQFKLLLPRPFHDTIQRTRDPITGRLVVTVDLLRSHSHS